MTLQSLFEQFNTLTVLVVGDVMIDSYIRGSVNRISPEAPVPIVRIDKREKKLGGAANVARNIQALGAKALLCSVTGDDRDGKSLEVLMHDAGLDTAGIIKSSDRITTVKHRIIAGSQHVLRLDSEVESALSLDEEAQLLSRFTDLLPKANLVIFEDYDKGVLTPSAIRAMIRMAREKNIPTVVDPKRKNFLAYEYASLFKPNFKELCEGLGILLSKTDIHGIHTAMNSLRSKLSLETVMVTLSEQGVVYSDGNNKVHVPAHHRHISDVSGAGDTVVSVASLCLALNTSPELMVSLSNLAGGIVCEEVGVVPINKEHLLNEAIHHQLDSLCSNG